MYLQTQKALDQIVQWADKWGFRISTAKTKVMIFGLKSKIPDVNLSIHECTLERVNVFKFLGV